jgi:N-acetylglucosaminyl-diphospho-decaprenol L-rhamnosyltransferase
MNPSGQPEISVLIPAYNGASWLAETLHRLPAAAAGTRIEVILTDNASSDETARLAREVRGVHVLMNSENSGFSKAVNQAAAAAAGNVLVVINQDLHLQPHSLRLVWEFLASKPSVVGGALDFPDGKPQPSAGPFPTFAGTLCRLPLPRRIRKYDLFSPSTPDARPVDWVTGAFVAFNREVFDRIGGFDEDYFMYYEDVDFCLRARQAGFQSYFLPTAKAVHVAPYSERGDSPDWLNQEVRFSQMTYFRKHRPRWEYQAIRALNRAYFAAKGWPWR